MAVNAASRSAFEIPRLARMSAAVAAGTVWILREVVRRRGLASAFLADVFVVRLEWFVLLLGIHVPQSRSLMWLHSSALSARVKGTLAARGRLTGSGFAPLAPCPLGTPALGALDRFQCAEGRRERRGVEGEAPRAPSASSVSTDRQGRGRLCEG